MARTQAQLRLLLGVFVLPGECSHRFGLLGVLVASSGNLLVGAHVCVIVAACSHVRVCVGWHCLHTSQLCAGYLVLAAAGVSARA